jgi:hypothetical protein
MFPDYRFSIDDGILIHNKEKCPHVGWVVPLSAADENWVSAKLAENPNCFLILNKTG